MPTGYCADYCFYEAYKEFIDLHASNRLLLPLLTSADALQGILKKSIKQTMSRQPLLTMLWSFCVKITIILGKARI